MSNSALFMELYYILFIYHFLSDINFISNEYTIRKIGQISLEKKNQDKNTNR